MVDRPILFSGPMVRAILDGRKTQTRGVQSFGRPVHAVRPSLRGGGYLDALWRDEHGEQAEWFKPRFAVGDRLWVREAWRTGLAYEDLAPSDMGGEEQVLFDADGTTERWTRGSTEPGRLRPGMHMPRWASRITLLVTDVRVQRLQDISEWDARAEGAALPEGHDAYREPHRLSFANLWDSINAKRGFGWEANPWVVAVTFERMERSDG